MKSTLRTIAVALSALMLLGAFARAGEGRRRMPPALMVKLDKKKPSVPLSVSKLEVKTRIFGFLAETRMTMTFFNPNNRVLEGDLYFPLPEGATVSGYALDIKGQMVDGVVVEKDRGRQVFEKIVRQGIDPGLVEWTRGNNFKTRVFPIPAKGTRTITVCYVSELRFKGSAGRYVLPLAFRSKIKDVSLRIEVLQPVRKPVFGDSSEFEGLQFVKWNKGFLAEKKSKDFKPGRDLVISLPDAGKPRVLVEKNPAGGAYFCVMDTPVMPKDQAAMRSFKRLTILWDASGSRAGDHKIELELLEKFFKQERIAGGAVSVSLVLFRDKPKLAGTFKVAGGDASKLLARIRAVKYDGGTQLGVIAPPKGAKQSDAYLLFTDGISNFGKAEPGSFKAPVYAFSSALGSDAPALKRIAARSGGQYFNLARSKMANVIVRIGQEPRGFLAAKTDSRGVSEMYPRFAQPVVTRFTLAGKLSARDAVLELAYGRGGRSSSNSKFRVELDKAVEGDLLRRYWAGKKLADLLVDPRKNRASIVALGKAHSIVTPGTSLIVLESARQYVEHRIRPPKSMPAWVKQYDAAMARLTEVEKKREQSKLARVLAMWSARTKWWQTDFDKVMKTNLDKLLAGLEKGAKDPKKFGAELMKRVPKIQEATGAMMFGGKLVVINADRTVSKHDIADLLKVVHRKPSKKGEARRGAPGEDAASPSVTAVERSRVDGVGAVAPAKPGGGKGGGSNAPTITLKAWDPKTPYIAALKAAAEGEFFDVYMSQRAKFGSSPAFFLDCADFFFRKSNKALGMQVLSNIAELELQNAALMRILGHRLAQIGELDLSVLVFEEVKRMRPEEPQSYRDLALVLGQRADRNKSADDYSRSLKLLAHVVMNKWDRFSEIELIALMELNAILARAKKVGVTKAPLDPRLVKLMPCDVRIILTWDADLTDMDLWVIEPTGEKAYYGHRRTTVGANFSRDFTRGYGPEEYFLKKMIKGKFKVQTNFFGSQAQKLTGAVTLQLEIFTNWGRPNQKSKTITVRLTKKSKTITIGEIEF
jgi:Ca-activated chloride channel homolog